MPVKPVPHIEQMKEYQVASQDAWRIDPRQSLLKLDWNESTVVEGLVLKEVLAFLKRRGSVNWYPDVMAMDLCKSLARFLDCSPLNVLPFGGSDVALETVARTYLTVGSTAAVVHPGYDNFRVYAESCGARTRPVMSGPDPLGFSMAGFIAELRRIDRIDLIYLINPNNPVGYCVSRDDIQSLLSAFPDSAVVVDEAYVEFAGRDASSACLIGQNDNLFVARSFSKAFGLAGLRLGYVVSDAKNNAQLMKIRNGKNLTMLAQIAGRTLVEHYDLVHRHIEEVVEAREWFMKAYRALGGVIFDSRGNFALVKVPRPQEVLTELRVAGVYVRDRSYIAGLENMIRISMGTKPEMARVLEIFKAMSPDYWRQNG